MAPTPALGEGRELRPLQCAGVPTAGATSAGHCGWSSPRPAKDSKGPELLAHGPCSGQERGSPQPIRFLGLPFRGFSVTGKG